MAGSTQYKNEWQKEKLDRISLTVPKGQKAEIQGHASAQGESVNGFINRAIREAIERDRVFEQNKDEVIALAQKCHVDTDDPEFKKIVEALVILESQVPDIKSLYFWKVHKHDNSSIVVVHTFE